MSALADVQRRFQDHLLTGAPAVFDDIDAAYGASAATRLRVYSNAYRARLIEALAANYPQLRAYMGVEEFQAVANDYIASHPSTSRSIRWYGAQLPACLEISHEDRPWLADLAQWEWTLGMSFDALDATPIDEARLAAIAPDEWPELRFQLHPSVQRVELHSNAVAIHKASAGGVEPPPATLEAKPQQWLVWRSALTTRFRSLADPEASALDLVMSGAAFEELCDRLCEHYAAEEVPLRAAALLRSWVAEQLIVGVNASP